MDVRCTRCGTEYEFDDALISERGTSVRCTQCGHQFRVFPPQTKAVGPDEWVVLTSLGRRVVYRSLRELQNGIARGEVAREDLLARGSSPPRPLGSIAELDPLFSTKTGPERKSSTLTGVAPPPLASSPTASSPAASSPTGSAKETGDANPLREHHDTWTGVAPPAKTKELSELAASPSPPMRVGGARTVIGIGSPTQAPTREPPIPLRAPETLGSDANGHSLPPDTRAFGSTSTAGVGEGARVSIAAGEGDATSTVASLEQIIDAAVTKTGATLDVRESEPPTLPPPQMAEPRGRAGTRLGMGEVAPSVPDTDVAHRVLVEVEPVPKSEAKAEPPAILVATATASDAAAAAAASSEPPTERWATTQASEREPQAKPDGAPKRDVVAKPDAVRSTTEPKPTTRAAVSVPKSSPGAARPVAIEGGRADSPTRPPSRPHHARVHAEASKSKPWGLILVGCVLLAGGLFAGMKLAGIKLDKPHPAPLRASAEPSIVGSTASATAEVSGNVGFAPIEEALEIGDSDAALRLLASLADTAKAAADYRRLQIFAEAMSIDMLWWEARLVPKTDSTQIESINQGISKRLTELESQLEACRAAPECKTQTLAAYWALKRMRGQAELAERPKQGTVDANGLYQLAMLDWVKAEKPDAKTLDKLKKARLVGGEQGPRVTALIVALIDTKRFDEARSELATLASASRAHPHLEALNRYLRAVDATGETTAVADGGGAESPENAEFDADLREPDFRIRLQRAITCLSRNEITKAQKLLRSVLAQRPNDTEAITGMGDVYRRRGDLAQARVSYDRALALNNNYLPAMAGAADVRWASGDRAGAVSLYRRIVERVGEGPGYGQTATTRIKDFEGAKAPEAPSDPGAAPNADPSRNNP